MTTAATHRAAVVTADGATSGRQVPVAQVQRAQRQRAAA